jgi:hypothetical protein
MMSALMAVPRLLGPLDQLPERQPVEPFAHGGKHDRLIEGVALLDHHLIPQHLAEEPIGGDDTGKLDQGERGCCRVGAFEKPLVTTGSSRIDALLPADVHLMMFSSVFNRNS